MVLDVVHPCQIQLQVFFKVDVEILQFAENHFNTKFLIEFLRAARIPSAELFSSQLIHLIVKSNFTTKVMHSLVFLLVQSLYNC